LSLNVCVVSCGRYCFVFCTVLSSAYSFVICWANVCVVSCGRYCFVFCTVLSSAYSFVRWCGLSTETELRKNLDCVVKAFQEICFPCGRVVCETLAKEFQFASVVLTKWFSFFEEVLQHSPLAIRPSPICVNLKFPWIGLSWDVETTLPGVAVRDLEIKLKYFSLCRRKVGANFKIKPLHCEVEPSLHVAL